VERTVLAAGDVVQVGSLKGPALRFRLLQSEDNTDTLRQISGSDLLLTLKGFSHPANESPSSTREIEQLGWLLRAARQLNEGVAIEEILGVLLKLTLQLTGLERGFCFLSEGGVMRFVQGLGADGIISEEDSTISRSAMRQAIESGAKFSVSDTLANDRASEWASVLANKIRSIYCIPLRKRGAAHAPAELLGLLYLDSQVKPGFLTRVDHQLLDTIAIEAAALLHNALLAEAEQKARKAQEELALAARIHKGLMSNTLPATPYAALQARSIPCLAIGGDFYDVAALDDCLCLSVVDVSGKGIPAAIVAATLQGILHAELLAGQSLPEIAAMVNRFLCTRDVGKYATMILVRLFADGRLEYLNCGHVQPVAILDSEVRCLAEGDLVVGLISGAVYASAWDRLRPGERLLLTSDGVTEAENAAGDLFGTEGLSRSAQRHRQIDAILDEVTRFQLPNPAQDDCTLVEICYRGESSASAV
jgi:serine phosphatase RsbU (regulator of sigma subunit)